MRALLPLALLAFLCAGPAAAQDAPTATTIAANPETPVVGEQTSLTFDAPVESVVFTYRPNSAIPIVDTVRIGGFRSIKWRPAQAGVVRIAVPGGPSRNLSVRFAALPIAGLFVLVAAGCILFGGASWAMMKLLSRGGPKVPPEFPVDT